ncbi:MAG: glutamate racemase [Porphyromonas sp.]|nr:glutamate racemase [Porphyromonas sp.]
MERFPIGIFDSGYGGLTILKALEQAFPQYDFVYLGDNARAPYGPRSFETIYKFTSEGVAFLLKEKRCRLIILACNTASAHALRQMQQTVFLPWAEEGYRVLGVIRPTIESLSPFSRTKHIGLLATSGTVASETYLREGEEYAPNLTIVQQACPMLVPLIESGECGSEGTRFFVKTYLEELLSKDVEIDTILLACTHYPLIKDLIAEFAPSRITILPQGDIIVDSLRSYLLRHPEMEQLLSKGGQHLFFTTEESHAFEESARRFVGRDISATTVNIAGMTLDKDF